MDWMVKLFSADNGASIKRFIAFLLVLVHITTHFMLMFMTIKIANKDLVDHSLDVNKILILVFGGYIVGEQIIASFGQKWKGMAEADLERARQGVPATTIKQNVSQQTVQHTDDQNK